MIEKQFLAQKAKENQIQKYIAEQLARSGYSHTEIRRTPLGEKVIIYTTRPGLVVGGRGENIQNLTNTLKRRFKMENPQIEIGELENPMLDVHFVCDRIVSTLERFGSKRFKSTGYKTLQEIIDSGALGAEIVISGKVPSARARSWRFSAGHMKKSGDISENYVQRTYGIAKLKSGVIGVKVSIMLPDTPMPDHIEFKIKPQETGANVQIAEQPRETAIATNEVVSEIVNKKTENIVSPEAGEKGSQIDTVVEKSAPKKRTRKPGKKKSK